MGASIPTPQKSVSPNEEAAKDIENTRFVAPRVRRRARRSTDDGCRCALLALREAHAGLRRLRDAKKRSPADNAAAFALRGAFAAAASIVSSRTPPVLPRTALDAVKAMGLASPGQRTRSSSFGNDWQVENGAANSVS